MSEYLWFSARTVEKLADADSIDKESAAFDTAASGRSQEEWLAGLRGGAPEAVFLARPVHEPVAAKRGVISRLVLGP